jgi:hypothetical protein
MTSNAEAIAMLDFEHIGEFIYENYVGPARENDEKAVTIDVRDVCGALNYAYTADLVRSVLGSMKFRNTYCLPLAATGGPPDGPPTTFTFKTALGKPASASAIASSRTKEDEMTLASS